MQRATCLLFFLISLELNWHFQRQIRHMKILEKNERKVLFQVCPILKMPLNCLTYNPADYLKLPLVSQIFPTFETKQE